MDYLKFVFNIRPELAHLGMPVWNMLYPFEGNISLLSTYNKKQLWGLAIPDKEDGTFTIDTELFSIFDAGNPATFSSAYLKICICYFKIAAQEKVEFENSCLYLSNEVFGVEDSSHLDSISISYQPDKNEAVYYQKVLMTPKAVANYLENAKHVDTNLPYRYISHDLYHSIVMDCSKETICKFVEDIYQPSFKWEKAKLLQRLERTNHRMSFSYDGFHR